MRKVCVDIDNTVLAYHEGLRRFLAEKGITFYPEKCIDYDFNGDVGCDRSIIFASMKDPRLYDMLPFLQDAEAAVQLLKKHCDVHAYTCAPSNQEILNKRIAFVKTLGITPNVFVDKKPVVADADALFDDCVGVHKTWMRANSNAKLYLINAYNNQVREENKDDPIWDRVIRCDSLMDAVKKYLNMK